MLLENLKSLQCDSDEIKLIIKDIRENIVSIHHDIQFALNKL